MKSLTLVSRARPAMLGALLAAALPAGLLLSLAGCQQQPAVAARKAAPEATRKTPEVSVTALKLRRWPQVVRVQGNLAGDEQAVIGAKVAGRVREVQVDLGTLVEQGQIICQLDAEDFDLRVQQAEAQLMQARAALGLAADEPDEKLNRLNAPPVRQERALVEEAKFNLERAQKLHRQNQNFVTTEELQQREATLRVAEARYSAALNGVDEKIALLAVRRAELAQARRLQTDSVTLAPFKGMVQERHVAPGVYVSIGEPIVTLVRTDPLRFRAGVPERQALQVRVGQDVRIVVEGQPEPLMAKITRISPSLEVSSRSLMVEADVRNEDGKLRTGLFGEAEIVVDPNAQLMCVPEQAVIQFAGVEKVWYVKDGQSVEKRITVGRRGNGLVEVLDGLTPGDLVISHADKGVAGKVAIVPDGNLTEMQVGGE